MKTSELVNFVPRLYHVTSAGAWTTIAQHGLLSTTAVLDKLGIAGKERLAIEARRRPQSVALDHSEFGLFVIRDQKPLPDSKLAKCVVGCTVEEYHRLLNNKVFFWADLNRVQGLNSARAYNNNNQQMIIVNTATLVAQYGCKISLCHKNSGALRAFHPLGPCIFKSIGNYDPQVNRKGTPSRPVVELAVDYSVPDIVRHVLEVQDLKPGEPAKKIYP